MFDIGFSELVLIGVVALVVLGPERLPTVARTLGHLLGRMQRYVNDVKSDIQREIELEDLKKLRQSVEDSARSIEQSVKHELHTAEEQLTALQGAIDPARTEQGAAASDTTAASAAPAAIPGDPDVSTAPATGGLAQTVPASAPAGATQAFPAAAPVGATQPAPAPAPIPAAGGGPQTGAATPPAGSGTHVGSHQSASVQTAAAPGEPAAPAKTS